MITLSDDVAAVVLDLAESMSVPMATEEVVLNIQRAKSLVPVLRKAFADLGIDPDEIERMQLHDLLRPSVRKMVDEYNRS